MIRKSPAFAVILCFLVTLPTPARADAGDERERQARRLYVEAANIIRNSNCQLLENAFLTAEMSFELAFLADQVEALRCLAAYRPASVLYDRIVVEFDDTEIAVAIVDQHKIGIKTLNAIEKKFLSKRNSSSSSRLSGNVLLRKPALPSLPPAELPSTELLGSRTLSLAEVGKIQKRIGQCWNIPSGAKSDQNLRVEIFVVMNPDATVREARIKDQARMSNDPLFRGTSESALRAVLNPRCSPLPLPLEKYSQWKTMTLTFDPSRVVH